MSWKLALAGAALLLLNACSAGSEPQLPRPSPSGAPAASASRAARTEVHRLTYRGWRGFAVRRIAHDPGDDPARTFRGRYVLRRGPYVATVRWVAGSQVADRRRSRAAARMIRGLG
jgi:hypothetical protein